MSLKHCHRRWCAKVHYPPSNTLTVSCRHPREFQCGARRRRCRRPLRTASPPCAFVPTSRASRSPTCSPSSANTLRAVAGSAHRPHTSRRSRRCAGCTTAWSPSARRASPRTGRRSHAPRSCVPPRPTLPRSARSCFSAWPCPTLRSCDSSARPCRSSTSSRRRSRRRSRRATPWVRPRALWAPPRTQPATHVPSPRASGAHCGTHIRAAAGCRQCRSHRPAGAACTTRRGTWTGCVGRRARPPTTSRCSTRPTTTRPRRVNTISVQPSSTSLRRPRRRSVGMRRAPPPLLPGMRRAPPPLLPGMRHDPPPAAAAAAVAPLTHPPMRPMCARVCGRPRARSHRPRRRSTGMEAARRPRRRRAGVPPPSAACEHPRRMPRGVWRAPPPPPPSPAAAVQVRWRGRGRRGWGRRGDRCGSGSPIRRRSPRASSGCMRRWSPRRNARAVPTPPGPRRHPSTPTSPDPLPRAHYYAPPPPGARRHPRCRPRAL